LFIIIICKVNAKCYLLAIYALFDAIFATKRAIAGYFKFQIYSKIVNPQRFGEQNL
jgi:hypothetical protein